MIFIAFCTNINESYCVLGSKQLLSAQKNHLNETVFSNHKNVRFGQRTKLLYFFTFTVCHCND